MSITHNITRAWRGQTGATTISASVALTGSEELNLDFSLAANTTNQQEALAFTKTLLQSVFVYSDQNITIKTNSTSTPQDTLTINAGDPLVWDVNCGLAEPFAGNVTTAYFTNSNATAANVSVRVLTNG